MSASNDRMLILKNGILQLMASAKSSIDDSNDAGKQISLLANAVSDYTTTTLKSISGEQDTASVNEKLANAMIQVNNFVSSRQRELTLNKANVRGRIDAYEQCLLILSEVEKLQVQDEILEDEAVGDEVEEAPIVEPEGLYDEEKKRRIIEATDETGTRQKRRKPGSRPEKLKDIRNVQKEIQAQKNLEEDN